MTIEANLSMEPHGSGLSHLMESSTNRDKDFRRAKRHSVLVRFLRLGLPLMAAAVVSLYFIPKEVSVTINGHKATIESVELTSDKLKMINPRLEGVSDSKDAYVITADHALQDINNPDIIELNEIVADIKSKQRGAAHIVANKGVFYTKKEFLILTGDIQITSESGIKAELDVAHINMKKQTITSKKPVVIEMQGSTIRSRKMMIKTSTREINFMRDVTVHIKENASAATTGTPPASAKTGTAALAVDRNQPVDITADNMTVFDEQKLSHFFGNVTVLQGGYEVKSSHLKVYYTGDTTETKSQTKAKTQTQADIRIIEAIENVHIRGNDGQTATANSMRFNAIDETLTMQGNVVLNQGKNSLSGQELFINMKTRQSLFKPGGRVHGIFINETKTATAANKPAPAKKEIPLKTGAAKNGAGQFAKFDFSQARDKPINIDANTLLLDEAKNQATFSGKVETTQDGYKINSDTLVVNYEGSATKNTKTDETSGQNANVKKIIAKGNVWIFAPDGQSAKSQWAEFDVKANTIVIGGNVVLTRGRDVLKGDKMVIDLNTGQSQMEQKTASKIPGKKGRVRALFMPRSKAKKAPAKTNSWTPQKPTSGTGTQIPQ